MGSGETLWPGTMDLADAVVDDVLSVLPHADAFDLQSLGLRPEELDPEACFEPPDLVPEVLGLSWSNLPIAADLLGSAETSPELPPSSQHTSIQPAAGLKRSRTWAHTLFPEQGGVGLQDEQEAGSRQQAQYIGMEAAPVIRRRRKGQHPLLQQDPLSEQRQQPSQAMSRIAASGTPPGQLEMLQAQTTKAQHGSAMQHASDAARGQYQDTEGDVNLSRDRLDQFIEANTRLAEELRKSRIEAERMGLLPSRDVRALALPGHQLSPYPALPAHGRGALAERTFSLPAQGLERRAPGAAHAVPGMWLNDLDLLSCSSSELLSRPTWDTLGPEVVLSALPTFAEVPQWALP